MSQTTNPGAVIELTDESFKSEVLESTTPVLVDFWASWCAPCRAIAPTIDALARDHAGQVKVTKLNIEDYPAPAGALGIQSIPAVLLFRDGEVVESLVGVQSKEVYDRALAQLTS